MAKTTVNLEILKRFEAAGLELALPMDVHWNVEVERGTKPPASLRSTPPGPAKIGA